MNARLFAPVPGRPAQLVALLMIAVLLMSCGGSATGAGSAPAGTARVSRGNLMQSLSAAGTTVAATQAKLSFKLAGRITSIKVASGESVAQGQVLAELDSNDLQSAVQQAQAADDAAHAGVALAQAKVQQLQQSAKPENITQANAALDIARQKLQLAQAGARAEQVQQAQAALRGAEAKMQALQNGPRPEQLAILQEQIAAAKDSLYAVQSTRDGSCNTAAPAYVCNAAQALVNAAQDNVDIARKQLALATAPPTDTDLQQAQAAVDGARAQLALLRTNTPQDIQQAKDAVTQAEAAAQLAVRPYTDADLAAAQAGVQQAQAQVGQAEAALVVAKGNLNSAQLVAPAAGKVLQVNNAAGEAVTPASVPFVLGIGDVLVNVSLPESSVAQVSIAQQADVTFDSLPDKLYPGKVSDVPPAATTAQNLVSYVAIVKLDQVDSAIRPGMNANVAIHTLRRENVLLVPNLALQSYQGRTVVSVVDPNGQTQQTDVQTGASDQQNTEVTTGLSEGQVVQLISKPLNGVGLSSSNGPANLRGGPAPAPQGALPSPAKETPGS